MKCAIDGAGGVGIANRWERVADMAPSPEDLLIAREELECVGLDEEPEPQPSATRLRQRELLKRHLEELSPEERDALLQYVSGGSTQDQVAKRAGLCLSGAQYRIGRATERLRWLCLPAESFTPEDVRGLGGGPITRREAYALSVYWRTTSHSAVQREMLIESHARAWRLLHEAIPKLPQPFRKGFEQLSERGRLLLAAREQRPSALALFIDQRLEFRSNMRIAAVTLASAYEGFAAALRFPACLDKLRDELRRRGATRGTLRVDWSTDPVRAWTGVGLAANAAENAAA